jgi:prepilin-type N-terminal cleavage/methylation domain-containing protein
MTILGTGKRSGGFTLLEMLGVITILALITIIVYPRFELNEEKTEALYIGRLITSDVELLRGEALANREILTLHFSEDGYDYPIGESTISRSFHRFEFKFAIPKEEPKEDTGAETTEEEIAAPEGEKPPAENPTGDNPTGENPTEDKPNVPEIEFNGKGGSSSIALPWEMQHFAGTLEVMDGEAKWIYGQKSKETKDSH